MKKILLIVILSLSTGIFSTTITLNHTEFQDGDDNQLIINKEHLLFKRAYDPEIDKSFKITKINFKNTTSALITFGGRDYPAKVTPYSDSNQTVYLFTISGGGKFSLTLIEEGEKIKFYYKIPNKKLFSKKRLRETPEKDVKLMVDSGFTETDIELVANGNKYTIFYTGYITVN